MSRRLFNMAMESNDEALLVAPEIPAEQVLEIQSDVNDAHVEIESTTTDVEDMQEAIQEGLEVSDTVVEVGDNMLAKIKDGEGLTEGEATMANVVLESLRQRLGEVQTKTGVPAFESFRTPRARVESTRIAFEAGVVDFLKKIWEKIKAFAKLIAEKIVGFVSNIFKSYGALEKSLNLLKARAAKAKGKPKKVELEKTGLAKFFTIDGKANLTTAQKNLTEAGQLAPFAAAAMSELEKSFDVEKGLEGVDFGGEIGKLAGKFVSGGVGSGVDKDGAKLYGPLPGANWLSIKVTDKGAFDVSFVAGEKPATKLDALEASGIVSLVDAALKACKDGAKLKTIADQTKKVTNSVISAATKVEKELSKGVDGKSDTYKKSASVANSLTKAVSKIAGKVPALHFQTVKAAADYASASLSNLSGEPEAPATAAA